MAMANTKRKRLQEPRTSPQSPPKAPGEPDPTPTLEERLQAAEQNAANAIELLGAVANGLDALRLTILRAVK